MDLVMKPSKISPVLWVVLGVSLGLLGFFLLLANPFGWKTLIPTLIFKQNTSPSGERLPKGVANAPTPYLFLPHGKQTYSSRGGDNNKSNITSVTYDPLDPQKDSNQTISAVIDSQEAVNSVSVTVKTDSQTNTHQLKLQTGTASKGTWSVTFVATDTFEKIYSVSFEIITQFGNKTTIPMPIR